MDFWGHVYDLRRKGLIPREWSRDHLRRHLQKPRGPFSANTITTVPSNQSVKIDGSDPGNSVKNGSRRRRGAFGRVYSGWSSILTAIGESDERRRTVRPFQPTGVACKPHHRQAR